MDCSPPGSSVHGILQARLLEWVAMPSPGDQTQVSCIAAESLPLSHQGSPCNLFRKKRKKESEVAQLCLTVCNPMDRSLPGSSIHGIGCEHLSNKGFPGSSEGKSACNSGGLGSIPGLGRFSGEGNGYPLQYSCLENSMDRGAWQTTVYGVAKSGT